MSNKTVSQSSSGMPGKENDFDEDVDLIELKQMLDQIGLVFDVSHNDLKKICYENSPADSRLSLLHEMMFRIHPEQAFWDVRSENELKANCLQVSHWFGLAPNDDVVMGLGTRDEQKWFWKLLLQTVIDLENVDGMKPIDIELMKHLDFIVLNSTVLEETIGNSKSVNVSADNSTVVSNLLERIKFEISEMQKKVDVADKDSNNTRLGKAYLSTKTLKKKQHLCNTLSNVQHDLAALLDKYKLLRPLTESTKHVNSENEKIECNVEQFTETFSKIAKMVNELKTFTELQYDRCE